LEFCARESCIPSCASEWASALDGMTGGPPLTLREGRCAITISDKTRKIIWAQSGNSCAICGGALLADATETDDMSIIGDEAHM
jgi:hypothetical protein